ncbi:MAG: aldehyde dehydrogenase family protein [Thermomicrobiales bacterium]|nr:aldehyde dehydrogenase family protein [Thermomicrobiales bacterium]
MSVTTYQNYIGGEWVAAKSGETFESRSPADADVLLGRFAASGAADVDAAVTAASEARASWRRTSAIARANILHKAAEILASRVNDVGRELTIEEGKTLKEGIGETGRAVQILRYYAGEAQQPDGEHYPSANPNTLLYTVREPVGVVGVITPWNFPIAIPAWKIAPALAFGNTVVFKPATYTPLLAVRFVEALAEAGLPPGVVNLVTGSAGGVGDPLIDDDRVTAISFTGSEPVGRSVAKRVSARGGKVQLELGGKNPAIVFADADLDHAVNHLVSGAMWSSGQKCTATSRALLDASIADEVTRRLTERIGGLATGDPLADSTQVGPVISDEAVNRILGDIESAESEGARLLAGGSKLEGDGRERGNFVAPTLFGEMNPESRFGQEEVFGPVLGITTVKDMDEALEIANSVRFGLSASIFTSDLGKAMHFINGIDAGIVHVNAETPGAEPQVPFGGYKSSSSYSREQGKSARDFYTQIKTVYVDLPSPA